MGSASLAPPALPHPTPRAPGTWGLTLGLAGGGTAEGLREAGMGQEGGGARAAKGALGLPPQRPALSAG